jgi:PAS domain S-box-containing protein
LADEIRQRLAAMSERDELEMLREAVQAANNVVLMTDPRLPDNPIIYVNRGFERLTGFSRDEVLGRNCRFLQAGDRQQAALAALRTAVAQGQGIRVELRNYRKDGSMFWNELHITPIRRAGSLVYFLGVQNDITTLKAAQAEQALMSQALEHANEAVIVTESALERPGPRMLYVNRAFSAMTGYAPEEVLGKTPRMFQGPRTSRAVLNRMRRRLSRGGVFQGETINYRKDGSPFILAWHVAPIRDALGTITHWVSTQRDVTERRLLERQALDISAREQQRIAGELHDALQQHLIGTALQAKALARTLATRNDELAERAEALYALVQAGVTSLRTVVQGMAPVQRSANGLMMALGGLATKVEELYGVPCSFTYEEPIYVDDFELSTQLYYIAQEAVTNAAKHAAASEIRLSLARIDGLVALTVQDDGCGFEPQVEAGLRRGIGLRLLDYRARLIGAQLELASRRGEGTTVTCLFEVSS